VNFEENIQKTADSFALTVAKDGGGSVTSGSATVSGDAQLSVSLQPNLSAGRYVVNWTNTSEDDGDELSGAFAFYLNTQPTTQQIAADAALEAVEANELATASAQAGTPAAASPTTAAAASPATAASTPVAAASPSRPALPSTGTGAGGSDAMMWTMMATTLGVVGLGVAGVTLLSARSRR
jgi:hypothetical protein